MDSHEGYDVGPSVADEDHAMALLEAEEPAEALPTASEVYGSLTGFEEIAIRQAFGAPITEWAANEDDGSRGDPNQFGRALAFVLERRKLLEESGKSVDLKADAKAKHAALSLPISAVGDLFGDEPEEPDPAEPLTFAGKDN